MNIIKLLKFISYSNIINYCKIITINYILFELSFNKQAKNILKKQNIDNLPEFRFKYI